MPFILSNGFRKSWLRVLRRLSSRRNLADIPGRRRLWIDLSLIAFGDRGTGIQRVVRNLWLQLALSPPSGYEVVGLVSLDGSPYQQLSTATTGHFGKPSVPAMPQAGDVFFALDLAPRIVWRRRWQLWMWRRSGVRIYFMVYDLLPLLNSEWFSPSGSRWFKRWLNTITACADGAVCISHNAKVDFDQHMRRLLGNMAICPGSSVLALGTDLGAPANCDKLVEWQSPAPDNGVEYVLMVGTVEPRKAYAEVLDAFEYLWATGERTALVIVGHCGWKVEALAQRLREHPEAGRRLYWLPGPPDGVLAHLYATCAGLLMASRGEGFGLPVVEALQFGKPVLVRDIPIFREVARGVGITFFTEDTPVLLGLALANWLHNIRGPHRVIGGLQHRVSWANSAHQLKQLLGLSL